MFWDRFKKRRVIDTEEMPAEIRGCPNCGSEQFYEGPSGGLAINVKCAGCGLWFNNTPFGLDFIGIKENVGESKKIVWYCPHCDFTHDQNVGYGKYPICPQCNKPLKVCWTYKNFPKKYCDSCDARFKCYTERGNW
jgi:hypothetical protein